MAAVSMRVSPSAMTLRWMCCKVDGGDSIRAQRGGDGPDVSGGGRTQVTRVCALVLALLLSFGWAIQSAAYAVLAHEAIIDSAWDIDICPLLVKRFPNATADELK